MRGACPGEHRHYPGAAYLVVAVVLLGYVLGWPSRLSWLRETPAIAAQWATPAVQARMTLGGYAYDTLRTVDGLLPPNASLLLVTPGTALKGREYVIFHRALYYLAPRPVWWVVPTATEERPAWWMTADLSADHLEAIGEARGAAYILDYEAAVPAEAGEVVADLGSGIRLLRRRPGEAKVTALPTAAAPAARWYAGGAWPAQLIGALGVILAAGAIALGLIERTRPDGGQAGGFGTIERLALAWALGAVIVSTAMLWLSALGVGLAGQTIGLTALVAVGFVARRPRSAVASCARMIREAAREVVCVSRRDRLLGGGLLVELGLLTLIAVGRPLFVWDSWVTWGMKARLIFLEGGIGPGVYADVSRAATLLNYPLLLPLIEAWIYQWLRAPDDRLVGMQSVVFFAALLGVSYGFLRRRGLTTTAALAVTLALASVSRLNGLAAFAMADVPLALYVTIALVYLVEWLEGGLWECLTVAVIAAGAVAWTKQEGLVLLALIAFSGLAVGRRRDNAGGGTLAGRLLPAAGCVLAGVVLAGPWLVFAGRYGPHEAGFLPVTLPTLAANAQRLLFTWSVLVRRLLSPEWGFLWPLVGFGVGVGWRKRPRPADVLLIVPAAYLGLMSVSYIFSGFVPYQQHVLSSIDRLMAQVAPAVVLWLADRYLPRELTPMEQKAP